MSQTFHIAILSDVHYACAQEQARGNDYEYRDLPNPARFLNWAYRHFLWLRHPLSHNAQLDEFLRSVGSPDWVIANGDYNCDTHFVGVSDDAALQSAQECLGKLKAKFAPNFRATFGDHELGKMSFVGRRGGIRLESWRRSREVLGLEPLWRVDLGNRVLLGVTSTLVALPLFEADALPEERDQWRQLREEHLARIRETVKGLKSSQRVILFCHDPSALPFLWQEEIVRGKIGQFEQTIIGHLHTNLIFRTSRFLAGMPRLHFLGHTFKRMSIALSQARQWRPFHVRLCPSLAGIQLLKDGGYYIMELDEDARQSARF
ncbi:MAG TPA: metallophosphoesterase, partial [Verrucomicrobiae bacterium]|nr:metallophosphoesterase [Verrucomicrobiae bacterium]